MSITTHLDGIGDIDTGIALFIGKVNQLGYTTLWSCSGMEQDHPDHIIINKGKPIKMSAKPLGWIVFLKQQNSTRLISEAEKLGFPIMPNSLFGEEDIPVICIFLSIKVEAEYKMDDDTIKEALQSLLSILERGN